MSTGEQRQPLLGREIHRRFDDLGPIQVFEDGNKRYLSFGTSDEQSCQLTAQPFVLQHDYLRAMLTVLVQFPQHDQATPENAATTGPQPISVLGLGGGLLASALWQQFPATQIHAVELRAAVAQVAYQYFQLPRDKRLTVHIDDAQHYVQQLPVRSQQLIFSELYLAEGLNEVQQQQTFLQDCARAVSEEGWLVLNLWKEHRADAELLSALKALFTTVMQATTHDGNWVIWASHSPPQTKKQAQLHCKQWQQQPDGQAPGFNPWKFCKLFYRYW